MPTTVVDYSEGTPEVLRRGAGDPARFERLNAADHLCRMARQARQSA